MSHPVLAIRTRQPPAQARAPAAMTETAVIVQGKQVTEAGPSKKAKEKRKEKKKKAKAKKVGGGAPAGNDRFNGQYGVNYAGVEPWARLCRDLGVEAPLNSKRQCKKALENIHVNIYDFLDAIDARARAAAALFPAGAAASAAILAAPVRVQFFDSEYTLAAYTLANHRVYPRREIKACQDHPLRLLMAHIRLPRGAKARRGAVGC